MLAYFSDANNNNILEITIGHSTFIYAKPVWIMFSDTVSKRYYITATKQMDYIKSMFKNHCDFYNKGRNSSFGKAGVL